MKPPLPNPFLLMLLVGALGLLPAVAQTLTPLHSFTTASATFPYTNGDGTQPQAGLVLSGNTLYGTASHGGSAGYGAVFAVNPSGAGFTNLYSFTNGTDGAYPNAMILSGNTLYGTANAGGAGGGTVFKLNTDGTGLTILHTFTALASDGLAPYPDKTNSDGYAPLAGLILSGNTLYGTTSVGGADSGTVFRLDTDGNNFTNLYSFSALHALSFFNSDGAQPHAGLTLSGNTLYGTASAGGASYGVVFGINTDGTSFTNLHTFLGTVDGGTPAAGLVLSGGLLYGTATSGGSAGKGTVFAVSTNGTVSGFTNLHSFTALTFSTNSDGAAPAAGLVLSNNTLYGTASAGGTAGWGTVFALNLNTFTLTNLCSFTATTGSSPATNRDGTQPKGGLVLAGTTLYGTASAGGPAGNGTVFSLSLAAVSAPLPTLNLTRSGTNVILTWATAGFTLQSTTNLATPNWIPVTGQNTVTNPMSGSQMFYRLSQ